MDQAKWSVGIGKEINFNIRNASQIILFEWLMKRPPLFSHMPRTESPIAQ
jgi:hypothetical protein